MDKRDKLLDLIMDVIACEKERQDALRRATRHVHMRVARFIDVDGVIFESALYWINCTNCVHSTTNIGIRNNM